MTVHLLIQICDLRWLCENFGSRATEDASEDVLCQFASLYSGVARQRAVCREIKHWISVSYYRCYAISRKLDFFPWDITVLSCLYRELCHATSSNSKHIAVPPISKIQLCANLGVGAYPRGSSKEIEAMVRSSWHGNRFASRFRGTKVESTPYSGREPVACACVLQTQIGQDAI